MTAAERQRRSRARLKHGKRTYRLDLLEHAVANRLIEEKRLTEAEALQQDLVEHALAVVVHEWAAQRTKR
jgi:hypothetical protein